MTMIELARIVKTMRLAQKSYFRTRSTADLDVSKILERRVDKTLNEVLSQPLLFDSTPSEQTSNRSGGQIG